MMADAVRCSKTITSVDLNATALGDGSAAWVVNAIRWSRSITSVNLENFL